MIRNHLFKWDAFLINSYFHVSTYPTGYTTQSNEFDQINRYNISTKHILSTLGQKKKET